MLREFSIIRSRELMWSICIKCPLYN